VEQHLSHSARDMSGAPVRDYRRGLEDKSGQKQWQTLWHFNEKCLGYPTQTFVIRKDRPSDDVLCSQCNRASLA
jgi:hypothetical protein